jgi:hypothetical protein
VAYRLYCIFLFQTLKAAQYIAIKSLRMCDLHEESKSPTNSLLKTSMHYTPQDAHSFMTLFLISNGDPYLSLIYRLRASNRA